MADTSILAALFDRLEQPVKNYLAEHNPVFENMTVQEIHTLLQDVRDLLNVPVWDPWTTFCRENARALPKHGHTIETAWLHYKSFEIDAPAFDVSHRMKLMTDDGAYAVGEVYFSASNPKESRIWSYRTEKWINWSSAGMICITQGDVQYQDTINKVLNACRQGADAYCLNKRPSGSARNKLATKVTPVKRERTVKTAEQPVEKRTAVKTVTHLPGDAVEIINTLFGIAETVQILETNVKRWKARMDELFPGTFIKGEQND